MADTVLGGTIGFMTDLGVYDVILPFLLVFAIVFAILEKTKIFGVEKVDGQTITRKNINAMVGFVMAFFVIGSSKLVGLINTVASQVFLLLLLVILFLMLAGIMQKEGEYELNEKWKKTLLPVLFLVIVLIFLNALGWLKDVYDFLSKYWNSEGVTSIILLLLVAAFVWWITNSGGNTSENKDKGD